MPQSPGAESPSASGDLAGIYDDPPNPLDLQPSLDEAATASALIGWEGGTVSAIGSDGTTYTLEVPAEALPFPTTIAMTPLSDLDGFPPDPAPEHMLGVELAPEGLQLAVPARLTMATDATLPEAGVATGDYLGHGQDAGLVFTDINDAGITFQVSHFSGYWSVWPIDFEDWRVTIQTRQEARERQFEDEIFQIQANDRQKQLLGEETEDLWDAVRGAARRFEREILNRRRGNAALGCAEAQLAMAAYISYDRTLQLAVGGADSSSAEARAVYEELKRPIPRSLVDLAWNLCLNEEYQRCAALGQFPRLATFLLAQANQRDYYGHPLTPQQISDGQNRLERCARWRVRVTTTQVFLGPLEGRVQLDGTSEIDVRFRAGGPPFGLVGATIDGETSEIQVNELDASQLGEHAQVRNVQTANPAKARINGMTFVSPIDGSEPVALRLDVWLDPGSIAFEIFSYGHYGTFYDPHWESDKLDWAPSSTAIFGVATPTIANGWGFSRPGSPYRAEFARPCPNGSTFAEFAMQCTIEVIVEHTPD